MAAAKKKVSKKTSSGKDLATTNWETALAEYAQQDETDLGGAGGGDWISLSNGVFTHEDAEIPQPMEAIILDFVIERRYFDQDYDVDNPVSPVCVALGRNHDEMVPDEKASTEPQAEACKDCWANKFGSADRGKGKACPDKVRLALLPAYDLDGLDKVEPALMRLPVTSIKGFKGYKDKIKKVLNRPLFGVVSHISTEPDPKTQFKVIFELGDQITDAAQGQAILQHRELVQDILTHVAEPSQEEEAPAPAAKPKAKKKVAKKAATKKAATKKATTKRRKF